MPDCDKVCIVSGEAVPKTFSVSRMFQWFPTVSSRIQCALSALCVGLLILNIIVTVSIRKNNVQCPSQEQKNIISVTDLPHTPCPEDWSIFAGSCYYFSNVAVTWEEAKHACQKRSSNLIVINSKTEQDYAIKVSMGQYTWIGLTEIDEEWKWVDGTPYNLRQTYWKEGQPNNWSGHQLPGGEDCAQLQLGGQWNDEHCSQRWRYICEKKAGV
uniref:C-type lectin domain-containing protein n=2 Tax=Xenopus tropicalis TaxID=8364 RepID=A0A1B8XYE4_XENTR|eukprot:XP_004913251.1 PREDICTED: asialoglycoprotein receptor 2-like isoform X1 [Xenopus tropicalis]